MKILSLFAMLVSRAVSSSEQPPIKRARFAEPIDLVRSPEHHNYTLVEERYGSDFAQFLHRRMSNEGPRYLVPDPNTNNTQITQFGVFRLGNVIDRDDQFVIFSVQDRPDILLKFLANCFESEEAGGPNVHPLLVESWFG